MLRILLVLGFRFLFASPASAQFVYGPGIGGGFAYRSGFHFSVNGPGVRFSAYSRSYYSAPFYGYAWVPAYGAGYGPGFGNPFFLPPPPIVVGPPLIIQVGNREPVPAQADVVKGDYVVIAPRKRDEVDRVAVPEKPPAVRFDPFAIPRPIGLTEPAADPDRLMKAARESLAAGEYGTAIEHLDRVIAAKPDDAIATFLKSQAQFAAGQYAEAVTTIRAGMKRHPGWPSIEMKPPTSLAELKRSLDANPDSTALQFLYAHQLWFGGDRDAARPIFERLAKRLKDEDAVAPFLKK